MYIITIIIMQYSLCIYHYLVLTNTEHVPLLDGGHPSVRYFRYTYSDRYREIYRKKKDTDSIILTS